MDPILSSILGPVCERVIDAAIEEYRLVRDVKEEIKKLCTTVSMIKGVLEDAERKKVEHGAIREWLKSLKQVMFDAEDVLDEIATADEALGRDAEDGTTRSPVVARRLSKLRFKLISCLCNVDHSSSSRAIAHRVKDINKKFDDISKLKDRFGLCVPDETSWSMIRPIKRQEEEEETSLLPSGDAHIVGRGDEMRKIKELLLENSTEGTEATSCKKNVHVINVVGMGGVGKTTLVRHAYNNTEVGNYFHPRMWVCISSDFDLKRITREIIEAAASNSEKAKELLESSNRDVIQNGLRGLMEGKRFLLVLDDVWEEDPSKWDSLCTPLMYGGKGSKIIVTTRSQKVASITKGIPIFLKDLSNKDLWSIFQTYAFGGHDQNKYPQLVIVGSQIVDKLKGSPLAAKTIGRLLNSNLDVKHWTNIMKSKTWVSPDSKNSIVPILKLSYDYLPGHLKQCFTYCSLFPEDHKFDKDKLVELWMAQQFIRIREGFFHVESMGGEYFDDLVCMSLFEKVTNMLGQKRFVMHDLIHNLAEIVSEGDCLRLEDNQQKGTTSDTVRHVSIASDIFDLTKIKQLCNKYENMRTLLFLRGCKYQVDPHLDNIFKKLQRLRVLGLNGCGIKELPASIGTLKHLRFLDLSFNDIISKLPESLCNLRNLQVLNLEGCFQISALPRNMSALINLRHLFANGELVSGIQGLGKLTALHELVGFDCARQPMKELADMGLLRRLHIRSLEEVKSREEAIQSRLDKKEHLDELTLAWSYGRDCDDDDVNHPGLKEEEEVLDSLQPPHSSIRELSIYSYRGSRSPSWMEEDQSWIRDSCFLRTLELHNCTNWEVLPPLGRLLCLDSLKINGMRRVRRIGPAFMGCCCHAPEGGAINQLPQGGFPSLQVLEFVDMEEWEEWEVPLLGTDADDGGEDDQVVYFSEEAPPLPLFLARLRELTISHCPKLRQLPPLPPTLTKLEISKVGLTHLPEWQLPPSSSSSSSPSSSSSSPCSLSSLEIRDCRELTSLADGLLRHPLPNLVNLEIRNCQGLVSLPAGTAFGHLTSLKELWVVGCPKLAWPSVEEEEEDTRGLPPSLERISIEGVCGEIVDQMMLAIVGSRQKLARLRKLWAVGCFSRPPPPTLRRSLPSSLQQLIISDNDQLDDETLSAWLRGLTSLRELSIEGCPAVTSLRLSHLTALEHLVIKGGCFQSTLPSSLQKLLIWNNDQLDDETLSAWLRGLTSLRELYIVGCPAVTSLPRAEVLSHLTALEKLKIKRLKAFSSFGGGVHCLVSLDKLIIEDCPELLDIITTAAADSSRPSSSSSALPSPARSSVGTTSTTRIRKLEIRGSSSMQQIKTWLLQCPSLQELHISYCPQLTGFGGTINDGGDDVGGGDLLEAALLSLSRTLQRLEFWGCENLRSLPPRLRCLSSLQSLTIHDCPQIRSLPVAGLPESLGLLRIHGCPALEERCKEGIGSDWPLISHIPQLMIG